MTEWQKPDGYWKQHGILVNPLDNRIVESVNIFKSDEGLSNFGKTLRESEIEEELQNTLKKTNYIMKKTYDIFEKILREGELTNSYESKLKYWEDNNVKIEGVKDPIAIKKLEDLVDDINDLLVTKGYGNLSLLMTKWVACPTVR